jgi:hypothetical protein
LQPPSRKIGPLLQNGSFVSRVRPRRLFVFNEIGSFVPLKQSFELWRCPRTGSRLA